MKQQLVKRLKKTPIGQPKSYRDGAEGFIKWCEDNIFIPIYPEGLDIPEYHRMGALPDTVNPDTGRSYHTIWEGQKEIIRQALIMKNGRFIYTVIVFCWMRGEGKSLLAVLIQLWKFFCWPKQQIMLGANSKDQIKFVHFDIMRDLVLHSPTLLEAVGGEKNVQQKQIRILGEDGKTELGIIRAVSSFTGILSNITGYTFSEIFAMKNHSFFVQIDGSIRNVPNALGIIDSTVSDKQHVLYQLYYNANITGKTTKVFFSYRHSSMPDGDQNDFWHPYMTRVQLDDYKAKFPFGEFERYFLNVWEAGQVRVFTEQMIDEIYVLGCDTGILNHEDIVEVLNKKAKYLQALQDLTDRGLGKEVLHINKKIDSWLSKLTPVSNIYKLSNEYNVPQMATLEDLLSLGEVLDTDWSILAGSDFGDPYAVSGLARTLVTIIAKGLPGSRTDKSLYLNERAAPKYVYVVLYVGNILTHSLNDVKEILDKAHEEFEGLDAYCSERYGNWDMLGWSEERNILFTPIFPSYDKQKTAFKAFYEAIKEGRFKSAPICVAGSKKENVLSEELTVFMHDGTKRWFGSPEKMEKYGIQDDCIFSLGWCMYGGRELTVDDFRIRKSITNFGFHQENKAVLGDYT